MLQETRVEIFRIAGLTKDRVIGVFFPWSFGLFRACQTEALPIVLTAESFGFVGVSWVTTVIATVMAIRSGDTMSLKDGKVLVIGLCCPHDWGTRATLFLLFF